MPRWPIFDQDFDLWGTLESDFIGQYFDLNTGAWKSLVIPATALKDGEITNAKIHAAAAIAYTKLALGNSIVNADIATAAAIAYAKLNLAGSIVNADVASGAAIAKSKLDLALQIANADISGSAAIAYSKLNLASSIVDGDIAAGAAIALSKLSSGTLSSGISVTAASLPTASDSASGIVELATKAEMETGTDTGRVPSVSTVKNHRGVLKAWVLFNGTGTVAIRGTSYNVSSITDNGTGLYTANFASALANANYSAAAAVGNFGSAANSNAVNVSNYATGSAQVSTTNGSNALTDFDAVSVTVTGDF